MVGRKPREFIAYGCVFDNANKEDDLNVTKFMQDIRRVMDRHCVKSIKAVDNNFYIGYLRDGAFAVEFAHISSPRVCDLLEGAMYRKNRGGS
ncbi:MAG: hypothetical protein PHR07_03980 [Acidaminococcaceae bacterium]|nr:hypothetical protein [Acidaminococcaceae bacterium]